MPLAGGPGPAFLGALREDRAVSVDPKLDFPRALPLGPNRSGRLLEPLPLALGGEGHKQA